MRLLLGATVVAFVVVMGTYVALGLRSQQILYLLDDYKQGAQRLHALGDRYGVEMSLRDPGARSTVTAIATGARAMLEGGKVSGTETGEKALYLETIDDAILDQTALLLEEAASREEKRLTGTKPSAWDEAAAGATAEQFVDLASKLEHRGQQLYHEAGKRSLLWQLVVGLVGLAVACGLVLVSRRIVATLQRAARHAAALQQRAEESDRATHAIVEQAIDPIIVTDRMGRIELFNRAASRAFGHTEEAVRGHRVSSLVAEADRTRLEADLSAFLQTGAERFPARGREIEALKKDGSTFPAHLAVSPLQIGGKLRLAGYLHDLTLQRAAETRLRDSHAELSSRVDQLRDVVAAVANGDLTRRAVVLGDGAMSVLSAETNSMIEALQTLVCGVQESAVQAAAASFELAAVSREHQHTSAESAASVAEIAASSKEIAQISDALVETLHAVVREAEEATRLAGGGREGLTMLEKTMLRMTGATALLTEKLAGLNERAVSVGGVVTTITKIADQTNLLSLNAAIEAEKAGEHGRGFAVVATEIRRLADQTAVATLDIERMVGHIQNAVNNGVMSMERFTEDVKQSAGAVDGVVQSFGQIIEKVEGMRPQFESVDEGMRAQAEGASQISEAIGKLSENAVEGAEAVRHLTSGADHLRGVSEILRESVTRFQVAA